MSDSIVVSRERRDVEALMLRRPPSETIEAAGQPTSGHLLALTKAYSENAEALTYPDLSQLSLYGHLVFGRPPESQRVIVVIDTEDDSTRSWWKVLWVGATGGSHPARLSSPRSLPIASSPVSAGRMRVDRLNRIQSAFGFPIQTLAQVLNVSRPQLYKWLDAGNDIVLQEDKLRRLTIVETLASAWLARSHAPLSIVGKEPLKNGETIIALLSAQTIDVHEVTKEFDQLAAKLAARGKSESQRMADAGFARRPSHRALPSDE